MTSWCINIILLFIFFFTILLTFKKKKDIINALIIFGSLTAVKIVFLSVWVIHQTGTFDWHYLQFPDEARYAVTFSFDQPAGNIYDILTYCLRWIGFDIANLKLLNILISSIAVVRLYSLYNYVRHKNRYAIYLVSIGGILLLHIIYYSTFVLKDAIFFYFSAEFLVQLIKRRLTNRWFLICLIITILASIRKPMVVGFIIFLFDKDWRFRGKRFLLFAPLCFLIIVTYGSMYYKYIAVGLRYSMKMEGERAEIREFARTKIMHSPRVYLKLVITNIKRSLSVFYQVDYTNMLILLLEWCTLFYLLVIKRGLIKVIKFWPIFAVAAIYFVSGIMTLYNIRYNIFPVTFLLYLSILVCSGVYKEKILFIGRSYKKSAFRYIRCTSG